MGLPQVQYAFLELPKDAAGDDPRTLVDKWAYFFREAKSLNVAPAALPEGPFRDALELTRTATSTPEEWEAYERAKMAEQDARAALAVAHQEGVEEGHKSGLAEGKAAAILAVLTARGISVSTEARTCVDACNDAATLDRWITRVATAASAEEVIAAPSERVGWLEGSRRRRRGWPGFRLAPAGLLSILIRTAFADAERRSPVPP